MPPSQVEAILPERDLVMMSIYARRHMLPSRRLQRQMAMVAQVVHADPTKPFSFYDVSLWGLTTAVATDEQDGDFLGMLAAVGGGNVVQLSRVRKKKAVN